MRSAELHGRFDPRARLSIYTPHSVLRIRHSVSAPARRARGGPGRSVRQLAHPAHSSLPRPLPAGLPRRRPLTGARGRALLQIAGDRAPPAARGRGPHIGRRHRRRERLYHRRSIEPDHHLRRAARRRPRTPVLRQLAPARDHTRAGARISPGPLARAVARAAARVRPRPRPVPERISAELGDRRPGDVLRVEVHECGTRAGELPYPGAGSGPRGGHGAVPVERDPVHALGGRPGPVRVWQLIPFRVGRQVARVAPGRTLESEWPRGTAPDLPGTSGVPPAARVLDSLLRTEPVPRVSPDGRRAAYVRDDGKGTSLLRVLDATTGRSLAARRVNGGVDYDWQGDTLVVTQLDFTSRWRIRSDLYRWVPGRAWRRATRGARLVAPAAGGGRLAAIALGPASARPTVPAPDLPPGAVWQDVVPSPDGRRAAGSRSVDGRWALVRRPPVVEGRPPVTFPEPLRFDSAPAVPLTETGYTMWPSLRPHFWIPLFDNAGPTGRFGGALTAGTDALGRFAYAADLYISPHPFRAAGDFALVSSVLGNPTLDLSAWASWADLGSPPSAPNVTVSELDHYAALGASFVTRRWRRLASVRAAVEFERTRFATIPDT